MIDRGIYDKGFISNPSNCECKCDKPCDFGEYLYYQSCKCRKMLVDKLVEECNENINGNEIIYNEMLNCHGKIYGSCTIYFALFILSP